MTKNPDSIHYNWPKFKFQTHQLVKPALCAVIFAGFQLSASATVANTNTLRSVEGNYRNLTSGKIVIRITGTVTGESGEALSGASVTVKGSRAGVLTDNAGNFSISADDHATLIINSVGYESMQVPVNGRTSISVKLSLSVRKVDEIVVIGYGTANKRDLTGSIVKIAGKEVADKPNSNPVASLQSKVAGLSVVNNGTPGAAPDIRMRGTGSIGNVHPLYVVDGIFNDNIDYINPYDIESIEVLKDPSSLAIFGVKGANGVIAITTKKAKAGQTVVNFNTFFGFKKLVNKIKLANADQFKTLFAEENANNGITTPYDYTGLTANTDWIDAVTRTAKTTTSNISISQSTEKNRMYLGMGYTYDEGIIKHQQLDKIQFNFNDEFNLSKHFKMGVSILGSRQNNPYDATWVLDAARKVIPLVSAGTKTFHVQNPYGSDSINANLYSGLNTALQNSGVINPLLQLENEWDKTKSVEYRTVASIFAELNFLKNFTFRVTQYADLSNVNTRKYTPLYYDYNPVTNTPILYNNITSVQENDDTYKKFQGDYILTFKKSYGDHNLTVTTGLTSYYSGYFGRAAFIKQGSDASSLPIPNDPRFWYANNGYFGTQIVGDQNHQPSFQHEYATFSSLARVLYNYKSKYFVTGSLRDDGSSQIPTLHRHQRFWAVGAAWDISKENFMATQHVFDYLKLKGSYGLLGNQTSTRLDGSPLNYPFYPSLNTGVIAVFGNNRYAAATPEYNQNPDLQWETITAKEIGVEANLLKNKLHMEFNYFDRTTNNLMTYVDRSVLGKPNELVNGGSIQNTGEEITLSYTQNISRDVTLNIGGNITFLKNKVLSLSDQFPTGVIDFNSQNNGEATSETKPGYPIGYFKGYIVAGIFQSYADILKSPSQASLGGTARPGDLKFVDVNGDGKIDANDRTYLGNPTPKFTYGTSVNLNVKQFNLSVDLGGVYGNDVYRVWGSLESPFQRVNYAGDKINRWHGEGTSNWVPIVSQADRSNYVGSNYNIEDGSYLRIRNIQVGYNFSSALINRIHMKNFRIFLNAQNPITWKHNSGYTPEFGGSSVQFGYDAAGGAIPAIYTMGLNVTF